LLRKPVTAVRAAKSVDTLTVDACTAAATAAAIAGELRRLYSAAEKAVLQQSDPKGLT